MLSRLLAPWRQPAASGSVTGDNTHYIFKSSLAAGARQLQLTDTGLTVQTARTQFWPWDSIKAIRLSYRPASMQSWRFRADIENANGQDIKVFSTTWHSISQMARQDDEYRAFIVELHRRLQQANSSVRLTAGINPVLYALGLVAMALIGFSIAGLFVRALVTAEFAGALFLVGFAAWFTWQIGGFMRRNQPRIYTFDALPKDVLP
ncbi:MAG: hypothetical protein V4458_12485 [Pseudomonadota bacterium]